MSGKFADFGPQICKDSGVKYANSDKAFDGPVGPHVPVGQKYSRRSAEEGSGQISSEKVLNYANCGQRGQILAVKYANYGQGFGLFRASNMQNSGHSLAGASRGL